MLKQNKTIMTPKEKAIELVDKYYDYVNAYDNEGNATYLQVKNNSKKCALITVNEILKSHQLFNSYWEEVRKEIINL